MDTSGPGRGALIAGISAIALFIFMFFDWFGAGGVIDTGVGEIDIGATADAFGFDVGANAWQSFSLIDIVLLLTVIAGVGLAVLTIAGTNVNLPVAAAAVTAGLGILATLLVLYRIIDPPFSEAGREIGVWLGLIASAGVAVGGWLAMQEQESVGYGGGPSGGAAAPPPPPPPPGGDAAPPPPPAPPSA